LRFWFRHNRSFKEAVEENQHSGSVRVLEISLLCGSAETVLTYNTDFRKLQFQIAAQNV
jgi:hypothetical protein